ncbi:hypothetical protein PV327_008765 [Microctonus hyperodae]|uniref:Uncharacterized protein n=1 Tax=Microctonus hyperodae TaxID=165561 RepID=A0AA39FTG0_MICHY|nr:hypothetical protein PV327_008765 [Microctonus hyperodae]
MEIQEHDNQPAILLLNSLFKSFQNYCGAMAAPDELPKPEILKIEIIDEAGVGKQKIEHHDSGAMLARKGESRLARTTRTLKSLRFQQDGQKSCCANENKHVDRYAFSISINFKEIMKSFEHLEIHVHQPFVYKNVNRRLKKAS